MNPTAPPANDYFAVHRFSGWAMAGIVAAHAALLVLLSVFNTPSLPAPTLPLSVHIITSAPRPPAPITPPAPASALPTRSKPLPAAPRPSPVLAAQTAAATASEAALAHSAPAAPAASATPATTPATLTQARFDAAYLHNPAPLYPGLSRRLGEEGKVLLHVHVDANGRPLQIEIKGSSGWPRLDQSALEAVGRWKFIAARRGDEPIDAWVLVPIVFNLNNTAN